MTKIPERVIFQFMKDEFPRKYKKAILDLEKEKSGKLITHAGFTEEKNKILNEYYRGENHL